MAGPALVVNAPVPVITSATAATGTLGTAFSYTVMATYTPTTFVASGLPSGLSLNSATGAISGVPAVPGTYSVVISATNSYGTGQATLLLTITLPVPIITSGTTATGKLDDPFIYQLVASNSPTLFSAIGLPSGLGINTATGIISGHPLKSGKFIVHLSAANATGAGTAILDLTVDEELPVVTLIDTVPSVVAGTGSAGKLTVKLSAALNRELTVHYSIHGSAVNGADYRLLTGAVKFSPGKRSETIKIVPHEDVGEAANKLVKIRLETNPDYTVGTQKAETVTIRSGQ